MPLRGQPCAVALPRRAYGPACSTRTSTSVPSQDAGPGQVDELVLARPAREVDALAPLPVAASGARRRASSARPVVVVLVRARRHDRVDEDLDRPPEPGPVALEPDRLLERRAGAFRRRRLSSAGTSSARCVAGVPGRSEYAAAKTWS